MTARDALLTLERLRSATGADAAARKRACLAVLARRSLRGARAVERLHEALCFLRASPDDAEVLADVIAMLARFERRPDLRRNAYALENSGIAGTAIRFTFYAGTARWLAARWGNRLTVDWKAFASRRTRTAASVSRGPFRRFTQPRTPRSSSSRPGVSEKSEMSGRTRSSAPRLAKAFQSTVRRFPHRAASQRAVPA